MPDGSKPWQQTIMRLAATRPASWLLARWLAPFDRTVLRITRNRTTATQVLTGLPVLTLITTGAKSRKTYRTPLVYVRDGKNFILIATRFGHSRNPNWYYNILADPHVEVHVDGVTYHCKGSEVGSLEREWYWEKAVERYPGYKTYQIRAGDRTIPILKLTPVST